MKKLLILSGLEEEFPGMSGITMNGVTVNGYTGIYGDTYISDTVFYEIGSPEGGISIGTGNCLFFEHNFFYESRTQGPNGIFYCEGSGGQFVFKANCAFDCCCADPNIETSDILLRTSVSDSPDSKNQIKSCSIARSYNPKSKTTRIFSLTNGNILFSSNNFSYNTLNNMAVGSLNPTSESTVSYCSIRNCMSEGSDIISFGKHTHVSFSNILSNNGGTNSIIKSSGNTEIDNCCIMNNECKYAFYSSSGTITVDLCTVNTKTKYGDVIFNKEPSEASFNKLTMLKLQLCEAYVDEVTFTPTPTVEHTPVPIVSSTINPQSSEFSSIVISNSVIDSSSQEIHFISTNAKGSQINSDNLQENGDNSVTGKTIHKSNNIYIIVGCVVAGVLAVVIIASVMWVIIRKKNTDNSSESISEELAVINEENKTPETHENGLWGKSNEISDDPFKNDFEEEVVETLFQNPQ